MRGRILNYDPLRGEGLISADDGARYNFAGTEWKSAPPLLRAGEQVDFSSTGSNASEVYSVGGHSAPATGTYSADQRSPIVAGLLALFLGYVGAHKFYLGYQPQAVMLLVGTLVSWVLTLVIIGLLGLMVIGIVCFVEAIIYLTKPQGEFTRIYVEGRRPWF